MKKIAIAVAAAMTAATASAMDFTLYGIVDTGLGYTHVNTLNEPTENRFEEINGYNSGSRFGFKGTEDLGNGYSVSFVLENGFSSDSGALGQGGRMFGREAQLKFHSPYGTLSFGRAGTLISGAGTLDIWGVNADVLPGGWDGIFNIGNYQGNGMRLDNMVTYQTPTAAGFTGYLQYSFANDTVEGDDDDSRANERGSNRYFAAGLTYNNGPLGLDVVLDVLVLGLHGRRADDDAEILRQHRRGNALETLLLVRRADFLRKENLRGEGNQHHVAAGQRNVGRQARTFGRNGLLGHLDHDLLPHLEVFADLPGLLDGRFEFHALDAEPAFSGLLRGDDFLQRGELRPQVEVVDKGGLFVSDVDECRVQSRHDLAHLSEVDVPHGEARLALLLVQFDEHLVLAHGD